MRRRPERVAAAIVAALLTLSCAPAPAPAAKPSCTDAVSVVESAMALMRTSARDESTRLRQFVERGWQATHDDLTVVRHVEVGNCRATGEHATVAVRFDVLGRVVAAGHADRVAFEAGPRSESVDLRVVDVGGQARIEDISALEPHVDPAYAINILTELANSEPAARDRCLALIRTLRLAASPPGN